MDHGETPRTFLHSENAGFVGQKNGYRWWFQIVLIFIPTLGKIPILTNIFFRWVGKNHATRWDQHRCPATRLIHLWCMEIGIHFWGDSPVTKDPGKPTNQHLSSLRNLRAAGSRTNPAEVDAQSDIQAFTHRFTHLNHPYLQENQHGTSKSPVWKGKSSSKLQTFIFGFHVHFQGCIIMGFPSWKDLASLDRHTQDCLLSSPCHDRIPLHEWRLVP